MPSPKKITPTDPTQVINASTTANAAAQQGTMAQNTIGQDNPFGNLSYSTTIDPITGKPKYQANANYTPEQQQILDYLQANQSGIGNTAFQSIMSTFPQYGGDPNLVGQAGSLTNQALDQQLPAWERFDAPARDQARTWALNQGLKEGEPAYQQMMDKLTQQQDKDRGQWLAGFQPQAFNEAAQQYQLPLENVKTMLGLSQPQNLQTSFLNTPTANLQAADVTGAYQLSQDAQKFNAQQNNAYWNNILNGGIAAAGSIGKLPVTGGGSIGGNLLMGLL
jgi:hypothetical protein